MGRLTPFLLLLILLLCGLLSYLFYSGPFYNFDDINYMTYAHQMLAGGFSVYESTYTYGFLFISILSMSFQLFGYTLFAAALPNFIGYILIVIFIFLTGRKMKGDGFGIVAALVAATSPYIFGYATRVIPDMLTGLMATISLYLFITAMQEAKNRNLFYFYSGVFAGLTIYSKLTGLLFLGFFAMASFGLAATYTRSGKKSFGLDYTNFLCLFMGALLLFIIYLAAFFLLTGNPIYAFSNYSAAQTTGDYVPVTANLATLAVLIGGGLDAFGGISPLPEVFLFGALPVWCIIGTIIALVKKERKFIFIAAMLWAILLYFFIGAINLNSYSNILVVARYLILIAAPMSIMVAYAVTEIVAPFIPVSKKWAYGLSLIFIMITIALYISPYLSIADYNLVVSTDSGTLVGMTGYADMLNANGIFVNSILAERFIDFISGYGDYNVHPMQGKCMHSYNGSLLIAFYNGEHGTVNSINSQIENWTGTNCTVVPLKGFLDTNGKSTFIRQWGFNISSEVYRIR